MLALAVGLCRPAAAQDETRADLADEAELQFQLGVELQQRAEYRAALEHYLASNRLVYNKNVVFNIAVCYERIGRFAEAFRYYSDYLAEDLSADDRRAAEAAVDRIRPRVALLRVTTEPPGATLFLDRRDLGARGRTPRTLALPPGSHRAIVELDGYDPAESEPVHVRLGEEQQVELQLRRILGTVEVTGEPAGAVIRVDDEASPVVGRVPATIEVVPGERMLIVSADGYRTARYDVRVAPRGRTSLGVGLELQRGTLVVDAEERGALIEIDGEPAGFTPAVIEDVPSGRHEVRITLAGFRPFEEEVEIAPNRRATLQVELRAEREVVAASREAESVEDAPASVTLISQEEIRAFGHQTVWDALGGVRGVYQTYDRTYRSVGFRGFSRPQDYGNRVLVTMDGHAMNDDQLGSSYVHYDARSDLLDVERIEVVRGPGSTLYGTNAFFGVVNLVTRDRETMLPPHVSLAGEGFRTVRLRGGGGHSFSRDVGFWASAGGVLSQGNDLRFPEFESPGMPVEVVDPDTGETTTVIVGESDGVVRDADGEQAAHAAARGWAGDFQLELYFNWRRKRIPTGAFDSIPGDDRTRAIDSRGFAELRWEPRFGRRLRLYTRLFTDVYAYDGHFAYAAEVEGDPDDVLHDDWRGLWIGGEARVAWQPLDWLRLVVGGEGRRSLIARLRGEYDSDEGEPHLSADPRFFVAAGYAMAELEPTAFLAVHAGLRYDHVSTSDEGALSPRGAVVLRATDDDIVKLMGGGAFRAPSPYELRYHDGGYTQTPPEPGSLGPERIWTAELEYTHRFGEEVSTTVSGYYNRIEDLIQAVFPEDDPATPEDESAVFHYENTADVTHTVGAEAEVRREWRQGWMLAAAYSFQRTRIGDPGNDDDASLIPNSPEHMFSFRAAAPLVRDRATLALRLRVESPRLQIRPSEDEPDGLETFDSDVPVLCDLFVTGTFPAARLTYGIGIRNLFDWDHDQPSGEDLPVAFVPQQGLTLFLEITRTF